MKHLFALACALIALTGWGQSLGTVTPNSGNQGESLSITITGINTSWGQETGTFYTVFSQNSTTVIPTTEIVWDTDEIEVLMDIPYNQPLGPYDVWRNDLIIENAFTVGCLDPSVPGCPDPSACNYDPLTTCGDGSCTFPGCNDTSAINYNSDAACDDGSCYYTPGCQDPLACNFDPTADFDNNTCGYTWGCNDPHATNFDPHARCDDGSCIFAEFVSVSPNTAQRGETLEVTITGMNANWGQESGTGVFYTWFVQNSETLDYDPCWDGPGCWQWDTRDEDPDYVSQNQMVAQVTIAEDAPIGPYDLVYGWMDPWIGAFTVECPGDVEGCVDLGACNYNPDATCTDGSCIFPGCTDELACNYDPEAGCDDASCLFGSTGCTDSAACNFDPSAACEDVCYYISGCTDPLATNFVTLEACDDGSCTYASIVNITPSESDQNNTLTVTITGQNTQWGQESGTFWTVISQNSTTLLPILSETINSPTQITAEVEVPFDASLGTYDVWRGQDQPLNDGFTVTCPGGEQGCTLPQACNYNPAAMCDDGSCQLPGCTDPAACNYVPSAQCDDGSCLIDLGCTDAMATNYDPLAECNDGSCMYPGCTSETACNYDVQATEDDGSCLFGISGTVYFDANSNGYQQPGSEFGLENWTLEVQPAGITAFTGDNGWYSIALPPGTYTITVLPPNDDWEASVADSYTLTTSTCSDVDFGFDNNTDAWDFEASLYQNETWVHCDDGFEGGLWFNNSGATTLQGAITLEYPEWLTVTNTSVPTSSQSPGLLVWSGISISPGENLFYTAHFAGPGLDYIGMAAPFTVTTNLIGPDGIPLSSEMGMEPAVVCAYDPNDKIAQPEGYTDAHYILPGDRIEYKIRFQNTGNFPAEDIVVRDTLSANLDWETFCPKYASHTMTTLFEPSTGAVAFCFEDIWLPDSLNNEPESHGYLVFEIESRADLDPGEVIHNTAHIFFDSNPAIVTNTTWHTAFDCAWLEGIAGEDLICTGTEVSWSSEALVSDATSWALDGTWLGEGTPVTYTPDASGIFNLECEVITPLCAATTVWEVEFLPAPEPVISEVDGLLTATGDYSWQWLINGEPILGETGPTHQVGVIGGNSYSVLATDENGCTTESNAIEVIWDSLEEYAKELMVYPNPASSQVTLNLHQAGTLQIRDARGALVLERRLTPGTTELQTEDWARGWYSIHLRGSNAVYTHVFLLE